jgi:hypothetical protein
MIEWTKYGESRLYDYEETDPWQKIEIVNAIADAARKEIPMSRIQWLSS